MSENERQANQANRQLPIAKNEDVEFASELADQADVEARERAADADERQQGQA
ncbi:YfhD-like protein [Paenibacillus tianmuensis]|uniref:YfhD-like protein n=1 Tax=Paenibacillus tianmuensis TaxID=624147 RepID=A0A1G4QUM5_9BACL|nr:YfhD family protein [Paenibacillus tianmuensis]SCW48081.1 YfhD-like protein [Paenibacillus tianmuensis]